MNLNEIILTPGNCSKDCLGNGEHFDSNNELIECCCEECDYLLCCLNKMQIDENKGFADT